MIGGHEKFLAHLRGKELDIRITQNGRWYDQKVTPDVMAAVCDAIVAHLARKVSGEIFTARDIHDSESFEESVQRDFGKPSPRNPGTKREYDKFIRQPLDVLESAGVVLVVRKRSRIKEYEVNRALIGVLNKIAGNEREASEFLNVYILEVLRQSGLLGLFENFFAKQDEFAFGRVKKSYIHFTHKHTPINGKEEPARIFTKVLNIPAYFKRSKGTKRGKLSSMPIGLQDIRYNQINFRDSASKKAKHIPRQQHQQGNPETEEDGGQTPTRMVRNVIRDVKKFHNDKPEILDRFSRTDPHSSLQVEGHHIFPKSQYPEFAILRENIILLTPTQHRGAHGDRAGRVVSPSYQLICLQKKLEAIMKCADDPNCIFYSFHTFKQMLCVIGILEPNEVSEFGADDVRNALVRHYFQED